MLNLRVIMGVALWIGMTGAGDVPEPDIPRGKGDTCVADPAFMRLNHMDLLRHERDETVLEGIRDTKYSLKECVACHAVNDASGQPVSASSPQHFCRACHDYAAVQIDCFECHASRPEPQITAGIGPGTEVETDVLSGLMFFEETHGHKTTPIDWK